MKDIKKYIIGIFIGILISSTTMVIAYSITSNEVTYNPKNSDWEATNVEDAVNDLYEYSRADTVDRLSLTSSHNASYGYRLTGRSTSLTLEKGNYIIFANTSYITNNSSVVNRFSNSSGGIGISYTNGECTELSGANVWGSAGATFNSVYLADTELFSIWKCNFSDTSTMTFTDKNVTTATSFGSSIYANAVKLD